MPRQTIVTFSLVLCLLLAVAWGQRPVVKFGMTLSRCGPSSDLSISQQESLTWWMDYTNAHGGIDVNGTIHDIQFIFYNDAFDQQLMTLLYERLIYQDKVDVLLGPLGDAGNAFELARKNNKTIMNTGDFNYYARFNAPNGTYDGWLFSAIPDGTTIPDQCYLLLQGLKASSAWATGTFFDLVSLLNAARYNIQIQMPVGYVNLDLSNLDDVIENLDENVDFFTGSMLTLDQSHAMMNRMMELGYTPPAMMYWLGPAFEGFRALSPWQAAGMIFPDAWNPSLNYTDAVFGTSQEFYDEFKQALKRTPDITDTIAVFAATAMKLAVEKAKSTDGHAIKQALLTLNEETFFGRASFSASHQQTNAGYYCFQVTPDGLDVVPISENAPNAQKMVYPRPYNYPKGFKLKKEKDKAKWLGLGLGLGFGLILLAGVAFVVYLIFFRYQVVFIPKSEDKGEW